MKDILMLVGAITIIFTIIVILISICFIIKDGISYLKYKYDYKHRFDKPPIAQCYCRDCEEWEMNTGKCKDPCNSRYMGETWFCCFAKPASKEELKRRMSK